MKLALSLIALLSAPLFALTEYPTVDAALDASRRDGRCVMLNFTGTDWCTACIHLKTKILDSDTFNSAMDKKLSLVEVDYPRTPELVKKISAEEWKKREALLVSYRAAGLPYAVLLDPYGFPFATLSGTTRTAEDYIALVEKAFETLAARDAAMKKAATLTGMDKARALADALNLLPEPCRDKYDRVIQEIVTIDQEDSLGCRKYALGSEARIKQMEELNELFATFRGKNSPEEIKKQMIILDEFLSRPDLDADVRQLALRSKSDFYAFLRDIPNMLKYMKEAHAVNPESRTGKKLERNILYTEQHIVPMWEAEQKKIAPAQR